MSIDINSQQTPSGRRTSVQLFPDEATAVDAIIHLTRIIGAAGWDDLCTRVRNMDDEVSGTSKDAKDYDREQVDMVLKDILGGNEPASLWCLTVPVHEVPDFVAAVTAASGNYREAAPVTRLASVTRLHTAPGGAA